MGTSVSGDELVTVVIPALNEERFLGECLDSVRAQDYRSLQIIVVDGGSTDGTVALIESRIAEDERIELLHNDQRNIPSSLNLALDHARGEWLVRVDAHSTVGQGYVRKAVERLREGTWAGVGGRKDGVGRTPAGRAIAAAMGSRFGVGDSTYHYGTSAPGGRSPAVRRLPGRSGAQVSAVERAAWSPTRTSSSTTDCRWPAFGCCSTRAS